MHYHAKKTCSSPFQVTASVGFLTKHCLELISIETIRNCFNAPILCIYRSGITVQEKNGYKGHGVWQCIILEFSKNSNVEEIALKDGSQILAELVTAD